MSNASSSAALLKPVAGGKSGDYQLSGSLDFNSVPALLQQGHDCFGPHAEVQVDLGGVTYAGSAAIGLLLEWLRQARLRKTVVHFCNVPQVVLEIARISDVHDLLMS